MSKFDYKTFNAEAFGKYVDMIPRTKRNELLKSGAVVRSSEISNLFKSQTGSLFATLPMYGRIGGAMSNYDGKTDIVTNTTKTFERGIISYGRASAWTEKDFSADITGGVDFMGNVARQLATYWDDADQATMLSVLKGVFSMTGDKNEEFITNHTNDVSGVGDGFVKEDTLLDTVQRACGDNSGIFSLIIMNSRVATNLAKLQLLNYAKFTDSAGIQRDTALATWNGRTVLIDDSMTVERIAPSSKEGKTREAKLKYVSYVLGQGAIHYEDLGADVPQEMVRNALTNGGETTLVSRIRRVIAPFGISFTKKDELASLSPTDGELALGKHWTLVSTNDNGNMEYIDHKAIPIARIVSLG